MRLARICLTPTKIFEHNQYTSFRFLCEDFNHFAMKILTFKSLHLKFIKDEIERAHIVDLTLPSSTFQL